MRIAIEPPGERWAGLLRSWWDAGDSGRADARRAAGLPTDRPIIMTGHQAEMWHPGILAKFLAADVLAGCMGGAAAWLIADQDDNEALTLSIPVRDARGVLATERTRLGDADHKGVPTGALQPVRPASKLSQERAALDRVNQGLTEVAEAMAAAGTEPTLARQIAAALRELTSPWLAPAPIVFATELNANPIFHELLARMREDPHRAIGAYNAAAGESIEAGVGTLEIDAERVELPLWRIRPGTPRERVYADQLDDIATHELAPRALLMTAIVRMAHCDLFIHGTGGAAYDRVTERWIETWLERPLAPAVMATADVLLPLEEAGVDERDVAKAVWRAHHARHDPVELALDAEAREKDALVDRIKSEKAAGHDPAPLFRDLQGMLAKYRTDQRERLDALEAEAARLRRALASRDIAHDRTWAFPLHDPAAITELRNAITPRLRARSRDACCAG